jgi:hypothetical protein
MPQIETWPRIPAAIRAHLAERMHDRNINLDDLNRGFGWRQDGMSPKDSGSRISVRSNSAARGKYPKTFLLAGQTATGEEL